jgi:hypothetical protein
MKPNPMTLSMAAAAVFALAAPVHSHADPAAGAKSLNALLLEVQAQQKTIADNQAKIDEKIAAAAEEVRLAKIYVSRAGRGGVK